MDDFVLRFKRDVIGAEMFSELIRKGGDRRYFIATRPNMRNARPLICKQNLSAPVGSEVKEHQNGERVKEEVRPLKKR